MRCLLARQVEAVELLMSWGAKAVFIETHVRGHHHVTDDGPKKD